MEHDNRGLDRHDMHRPGNVLHIGEAGTRIISGHRAHNGIHHQPHHRGNGATDWAGVRSGRDYDKWKETGLTPIPGEKVKSPTIEESPLSIECRVKRIERLGSHSMFIAEVLGVRADSRFIDKETGKFDLEKAGLIAYSHGTYHKLGPAIGKFGFSVQKRK